jgi:hypothetical protein
MAWGLEARVPFLDKAFLEVALNVDPEEKLFGKGERQQFDEDGLPKMEKASLFSISVDSVLYIIAVYYSQSLRQACGWKGIILALPFTRDLNKPCSLTFRNLFFGGKRNSSLTVWATPG